jgi:hypothetical protein
LSLPEFNPQEHAYSQWLQCNDLQELHQVLLQSQSLVEHNTILWRMLVLNRQAALEQSESDSSMHVREPEWTPQDLRGLWMDLKTNPDCLQAIFLRESVFRDHLFYMEASQEHHEFTGYYSYPRSSLQEEVRELSIELEWGWGLHEFSKEHIEQLREEMEAVPLVAQKKGITTRGKGLCTNEDIEAFLSKHCPLCSSNPLVFSKMKAIVNDNIFSKSIQKTFSRPTGRKLPRGHAQVEKELNSDVVEIFQEAGGWVEDNPLVAPEYSSRHSLDGGLLYAIQRGPVRITYTPHASFSHEGKLYQQKAIESERGALKTEGGTPEQTARALRTLGLLGNVEPMVPREITQPYGRFGRVPIYRDEFLAGENTLAYPEDKMVVHGLTGVNSPQAVTDRVARMVELGGLLSIAERRRSSCKVVTLSPQGDMASGIDHGVPCHIGLVPAYGDEWVTVVMKNEVLERRDIWFAPRDFGPCENRKQLYEGYAKSLEVEGIHSSPKRAARQRHFHTGTERFDNEVYLNGQINWHEIDSLIVSDHPHLAGEIKDQFLEAQAAGKMPPVRVECVNLLNPDGLKDIVAARKKALRPSHPWQDLLGYTPSLAHPLVEAPVPVS